MSVVWADPTPGVTLVIAAKLWCECRRSRSYDTESSSLHGGAAGAATAGAVYRDRYLSRFSEVVVHAGKDAISPRPLSFTYPRVREDLARIAQVGIAVRAPPVADSSAAFAAPRQVQGLLQARLPRMPLFLSPRMAGVRATKNRFSCVSVEAVEQSVLALLVRCV